MGDHSAIRFPAEILKEWAESGVDLPSLFATPTSAPAWASSSPRPPPNASSA
jgi:hypothetical protein